MNSYIHRMDEMSDPVAAVQAAEQSKAVSAKRSSSRLHRATIGFLYAAAAMQGMVGLLWWYILPSIDELMGWAYVGGFVPLLLLAILARWRPLASSLMALVYAGLFLAAQFLEGGAELVLKGFGMFKAPVLGALVLAAMTAAINGIRRARS